MSNSPLEDFTFESPTFESSDELVDLFCKYFDGNEVHLPGHSNEIMPAGTVPGLMLVSLAAKAVLRLPTFQNILCARSFNIKFISPGFRNQIFFVRGKFSEVPHRSRPQTVYRTNHCEIICKNTGKVVISYEITQLLKA